MSIMIPAWENGVLKPCEKLDVHVRGLRHKAISVFVMHGQDTLLQRRALSKYHTPGLWTNSCCTHPHWGEDLQESASRRLDEELGLKTSQLEFRHQTEYRADVGQDLTEHEVVHIFVVNIDEKPELDVNPDEVCAIKWMNIHDLKDHVATNKSLYTPWLQIYLQNHFDVIFPIDENL